jgi:hypothetical protein
MQTTLQHLLTDRQTVRRADLRNLDDAQARQGSCRPVVHSASLPCVLQGANPCLYPFLAPYLEQLERLRAAGSPALAF